MPMPIHLLARAQIESKYGSNARPIISISIYGWKEYQDQLIRIVSSLTPEQLAVRVAPDLRLVGETIAHIVGGRAVWFSGVLREGNEETAVLENWGEPGQPLLTATEYVQGLQVSWDLMDRAMARWTVEELSEPMVLPWIGREHPITRSFVVWHIFSRYSNTICITGNLGET